MQKYALSFLWTIGVFCVALTVYLLTACYVPFPGLSSTYATELLIADAPKAVASHLDLLFFSFLTQWATSASAFRWVVIAHAILGALTVTGLFRLAVAGVRLACVDGNALEQEFPLRARRELRRISLLVGLGVALLGMVALPLWTMATRPMPEMLLTVLSVGVLTLTFGLRWRGAAYYLLNEGNPIVLQALTFCVFALAAFLPFQQPLLLPVSMVSILLGGWLLIKRDLEHRLVYFVIGFLGIGAGVLLSILVEWMWVQRFMPEGKIQAVTLWGMQAAQILPTIMAGFFNFESAAALILFVASAALFFGTFPVAYLQFGRGFVGQFTILVLLGLVCLQWPQAFAETFYEPTALITVGTLFLLLLVGLLFGSWARAWYDSHTRLKPRFSNRIVMAFLAGCFGCVAALLFWLFMPSAASGFAQPSLEKLWASLDTTLPTPCTYWWKPETRHAGMLLYRQQQGTPIRLLGLPSTNLKTVVDEQSSLETSLYALSPHAFATYCVSARPSATQIGALSSAHAETLEAAAKTLDEHFFGKTLLGERLVKDLQAQAARAYVTRASMVDAQTAAPLLRHAHQLDPENKSATLGIGALIHENLAISEEERLAATMLIESERTFREPTPEVAIALAKQYGPVRSLPFVSADRLHRLRTLDAQKGLETICALYRQAPNTLSARERQIAVLFLPEAEAGALLLQGRPSGEELRLYLCAYPWTKDSMALWEKYHETVLEEADGLSVLLRTKAEGTRRQLLDRAHTFFLRDKHFAYALFYVNGLIEDDRLADAVSFVSGFNVLGRLKTSPYSLEELRLQVARALYAQPNADLDAATRTLEGWLFTDPNQPRLWSFYLSQRTGTDPLVARRCLQLYPFHAGAIEYAKAAMSPEDAAQYANTMTVAREALLNDKETYAHR